MRSVSLRSVRNEADILEVSALAHEIWREHYAPILAPAQIEYMLETMQSPGPIREQISSGTDYRLIRRAGRSVGYVAWRLNEPAGRMFLSKVYLLKEARGKGYFRDVLELLDEAARAARQEAVWLTVNRSNPSVGPYEALGFRTVREQDVDIGGGFEMNDYVMERAVAGNTAREE